MKNIKYLAVVFFATTCIATMTSANEGSSGYNTPIVTSKFSFSATLQENRVTMKWNLFKNFSTETLRYYKVVRSSTNANPVYPDDGYIKYDTDENFSTYTDTEPQAGTNYYRVCAITEKNNRYCSNVIKIDYKKETAKTTNMANPASVNCGKLGGTLQIKDTTAGQVGYCKFPDGKVCEEWALFRGECGKTPEKKLTVDSRVTKLVSNFEQKLTEKFGNDTQTKLTTIDTVLARLEALKTTKPNLVSLINEVINSITALKEKLQNTGEIEKALEI